MDKSDADRLVDMMLVASILGRETRAPSYPDKPALELRADGWHLYPGDGEPAIPIPVAMAYEAAVKENFGQDVLDRTRELCGRLRIIAKRRSREGTEAQLTLDELRAGLAEARAESRRRAARRLSPASSAGGARGVSCAPVLR